MQLSQLPMPIIPQTDRPQGKIKVNVKRKVSKEELINSGDSIDIKVLVSMCRNNKIVVNGDRTGMCRSLLRVLYGVELPKNKDTLLREALMRLMLWNIGYGNDSALSINSHDFYTDQPIQSIPKVFMFCLHDSNKCYAFDVRSLHEYYLECQSKGGKCVNPYTYNTVDDNTIVRLNKKLRWLKRLRYPTLHKRRETTSIKQYTINVFHKISMYQYVDYEWYTALTFRQLKKLYQELTDLWTYRLSLTYDTKCLVVNGGQLFTNWTKVEKYTASMKDILYKELLKNIERLVTEGKTPEDRKSGTIYFMLGFVQVSAAAAEAHPTFVAALGH